MKPLPRKPSAKTPHIKLRRFRHRQSYWFVVKPTTWNHETSELVRKAREFTNTLNLQLELQK